MWDKLKQILSHKDLTKRLLFVAFILVLTRILAHIPIPGVDIDQVKSFFEQNQVFGLVNLFSGGGLSNFSIGMMSVFPYISAAIIMQLLTFSIPTLENLRKEGGEEGRRKISQYTRLLTVPLAGLQAFAMVKLLQSQQVGGVPLVGHFSIEQWFVVIITLVSGTLLIMWLGELITENGVGNGISIIIMASIIAGLPSAIGQSFQASVGGAAVGTIVILGAIAALTVLAIVFITEGQRNIPVTYARRAHGLRGSQPTDVHIPLRVTQAGVIPIIFAVSLVVLPNIFAEFFKNSANKAIAEAARTVGDIFATTKPWYWLTYFLLVIAFTYFWTSLTFNPKDVAENIQKQGGFIPGIRPGQETEKYLKFILNRITLAGGIFLGLIAILPFLVQFAVPDVRTLTIGGTSILIVISVVIETMKQVNAQLLMRRYDHYQHL
ncbi:preprotein translocase subunit SecY [Patescibacteria group bacterium]|nr:preprotein translocase subunit SecY [Patescibacteria group bacterium]